MRHTISKGEQKGKMLYSAFLSHEHARRLAAGNLGLSWNSSAGFRVSMRRTLVRAVPRLFSTPPFLGAGLPFQRGAAG
jgi:hypothetical protein